MLRLTVDRKALITRIQKEGDTAVRIAQDHGIRVTTIVELVKHFNESQDDWFEPGCSEHKFLQIFNGDVISPTDVVTIDG